MLKFYSFKSHYLTLVVILFTALNTNAQDISSTPSTVDFGDLEVGQTQNMTITLTNNTSDFIDLTSFMFSGPDALQFNSSEQSLFIEPNSSVQATLRFEPSSEGEKTANWDIGNFDTPVLISIPVLGFGGERQVPNMIVEDVDFGTVDVNQTISATMNISNTGTVDLEITEFNFDSSDFSADPSVTLPLTITSGGNMNVPLNFTPQANNNTVPERVGMLTIVSNDFDPFNEAANEDDEVRLTGVAPLGDSSLDVTTLNYPSQSVNDPATTMTFTVSNTGDGDLIIENLSIDPAAGNPDATGDYSLTTSITFPLTIASMGSQAFEIAFAPQDDDNRFAEVNLVSSNDGGSLIPIVDLIGTATKPEFSTPVANIEFPETNVDETAQRFIQINNVGTETLQLSAGVVSGEHASDFTTVSTSQPISAGGSGTDTFEFTPSGSGLRTATITYTSNDPNSPHVFEVSGVGGVPVIDFSAVSIDFGTLNAGESSTETFTISNTGTGTVTVSEITLASGAIDFEFDVSLPITIGSGGSQDVSVIFAPEFGGSRVAQYELTTNVQEAPFIIELTGESLIGELTTTGISFRDTKVLEETRTAFFTLGNTGDADITVNSINYFAGDNVAFTLETITFPLTIAPGDQFSGEVSFTPQVIGNTSITYQAVTEFSGSVFVNALGRGIGTEVRLFDLNIDFEDVNITETKTNRIFVGNGGESDLEVTNITVTGDGFALTEPFEPFTVPFGPAQAVEVTFTPQSLGASTATFTVESNDPRGPQSQTLTANVTNLPTIDYATSFGVGNANAGQTIYAELPIMNTGSTDLIINSGAIIDRVVVGSVGTDDFAIEDSADLPPEFQSFNQFPVTISSGQTTNILVSFTGRGAVTSAVEMLIPTNETSNGEFDEGLDSFASRINLYASSLGAGFIVSSDLPLEAPDTSLGRENDFFFELTSIGTEGFRILNITGDENFTYDPDFVGGQSIELGRFQRQLFRVVFNPTADARLNGILTVRTNIPNTDTGEDFTDFEIEVTGLGKEPEEVDLGTLMFEADNKTQLEDGRVLLSGNVHSGDLEFSGDVIVDTATGDVTGSGDVFVKDIPEQGVFGGERVLVQSGDFEFTTDDAEAALNIGLGGAASGITAGFNMVGLPLAITKIKLIPNGVQLGGKLTLPVEVFGEGSNITLETVEIHETRGVNVIGSAEVSPGIKVLNTFELENAMVTFDTFQNNFSGSATIMLDVLDREVGISAGIDIVNGGLNGVSLEITTIPGVPLGSTGFELIQAGGFINGIQTPPLSIGLIAGIQPVGSSGFETVSFTDMTIEYTLGTSLSASGVVNLYGEPIGGGSVTIKASGFAVSAFVDLYGVFKGQASLAIEDDPNDSPNRGIQLEASVKLTVTIPKLEGTACGIPCKAANKFLPIAIAELEASFTNTTIRASATIAEVLEIEVKVESDGDGGYDTSLGGNFLPLNFSFFNGQNPSSFNNGFYFMDNPDLRDLDPFAGQSLVYEGGSSSSRNQLLPVAFTLGAMQDNIIVRIKEANAIGAYTLLLPDGTELTPENAEDLGHLYTTFEPENEAYFILKDAAAGDYEIRVPDGGDYEFDLLGAEFSPTLAINDVSYDSDTEQVTLQWTDGDPDSDASLNFYTDTDALNGDGDLVLQEISEDDAANTASFNVSALENGTYHVYGRIRDTENMPVTVYAPQTFTVDRPRLVAAPELLGELDGDVFELSWAPILDADHYLMFIDENELTVDSPSQTVGDQTTFDFSEINPGRTYNFAVVAIDEDFNQSALSNVLTFQYISEDENNIPMIDTQSLPNRDDACAPYVQDIAFSDPDTEDVLTLSLDTFPEGMVLNGNTITWTPTPEQFGQNNLIVQVDDGQGGVVTKQLIILVTAVDGDAPIPDVETLADVVEECNATLTAPTASDVCSGSITATTEDETTFTEQGTYEVTWVYTDANGNEVEQIQNVIIDDITAPIFDNASLPSNTTRTTDSGGTYSLEDFTSGVTFTENCSATITQSPVLGTTFSPGMYDITITVTDVANQTDTHIFELTVEDEVLGIDELAIDNFTLYPNPTERFIMINNPNNEIIKSVEVYDLNGKVVTRMIPTSSVNDVEIDTSSLQTGMYLMKINTDAGQMVKTFLKE